jgi:hypothetical protein
MRMTSESSDLLPGYWVDPETGAWCTIPWPSDPDEKQRIADWSLGPLLIRWAENRLTDEEFEQYGPGLIHHQTGEPWRFTPGQKRYLILWYQFTPEGRYVYRSGVKRGAKGTGKDPFAAAHGNCELVGPAQLVFDEESQSWTGVPYRMPLVQVSSNSEEQSKDVLRVANAMWSRDARDWHGLDCGETRTILKGRGRLEVLTASESSSEGDPATFIILNESHHMTQTSGGHKLSEVARRNVGKSARALQARMCEYTNAHTMGTDSTAERSFVGWQQQASGRYKNLKQDILYDSIEANPNLNVFESLTDLRTALRQAYSDAEWADLERLEDEVRDPRTSPAEAIRFYLNGLGVREDAWIDPRNWDSLARVDTVADKERVTMFLDCSKSQDSTGLVCVRLSDGYTFVQGFWQPQRGARGKTWLAPREEVDATVREAFDRYKVVWFGVDPSPAVDDDTEHLYWTDVIDQWHRDFGKKLPLWATPGANIGHSVLFDMRLSQRGAVERNQAFTEMAERVGKWIDEEQSFHHDGDPAMRIHVHNARNRPNRWGVSIGKENRDSKKLVDLAVCMVGAQLGRRIALNSSKVRGTGERKVRKAVIG